MKSLKTLLRATLIMFHVLAFPVLAAGILAMGVYLLPQAVRPATLAGYIAISPVLYAGWLGLMLGISALNIQVIHRLGWKKPGRFEMQAGGGDSRNAVLVCGIMLRVLMTWSLPGVRYLLRAPILDRLIQYAYAPAVHLGKNSHLWGLVYDPELTYIDDGAVIGGDSTLSAHAVTTKPDGNLVYTSAPIRIGKRALVGASSRVALGVSLGDDAIILPGSEVLPYSQIPAGEVWGGNPAVFVRRRAELDAAPVASEVAATSVAVESCGELDEVRALVAETLSIPMEQVGPAFGMDDSAAWDSLAQMAMAAAIQNRFGVCIDSQQIFKLRSVRDIAQYLGHGGMQTSSEERTGDELPTNPELIPLLDTVVATRLLSRQAFDTRHELDVIVSANFTAQQAAPAITSWSRAFGVKTHVEFLGFDQVQESLRDPQGALRKTHGLGVVMLRTEDLLASDLPLTIERADLLLQAVEECAKHSQGKLVVSTLPPALADCFEFEQTTIARLRAHWNSRICEIADIEVLDLSRLVERLGLAAAAERGMALKTRSPYSTELYQELGREISRIARKRFRPAAKVLALDADNTLWGGVIAEDGADALQVGADGAGRAFQMFQEAILKLRERGVLLTVVSKNTPEDVWKVFDGHPGMKLKRSHITASRINWQPKSENLKELARELNLGLDSFVFFDDDALNRADVAANAPGVTVVPMPTDPAEYVRVLTQLWQFDSATGLTAEDRQRAAMMEQEQQRKELLESQADLKSYLHTLNLRVEMRRATAFDLPRVAQLEQKTNQFNLALRRRSLDELKALSRKHAIYVVNAADRFGDYGLIGSCILAPVAGDPKSFLLDTLILSCRALGRGVEEALLHGVLQEVRERNGSELVAEYVAGPRNHLVREFLDRSGFEAETNRYRIPVDDSIALPDHVEWVSEQARHAG